jgi:hypothetical protein
MEEIIILLEGTPVHYALFLITNLYLFIFSQNSYGSAMEFDILPGTPNEDS